MDVWRKGRFKRKLSYDDNMGFLWILRITNRYEVNYGFSLDPFLSSSITLVHIIVLHQVQMYRMRNITKINHNYYFVYIHKNTCCKVAKTGVGISQFEPQILQ